MRKPTFIFSCFAIISLMVGFPVLDSLAKTDLSISTTDITFSKEKPLEAESVRVFARVFNLGDTDIYGYVLFLSNGKEMADPQPISVKANTYDDVFIDWLVKGGTFNIEAKIIGTNFSDDNPANDKALRENYFVDLDSDKDGVGNGQDTDDDNDGLPDEKEIVLGTNPLNQDSDGDKARDNIDQFPLDSKEWQDLDRDNIGDNQDLDDDNDGISDNEELFIFGTNPLSPDSDSDGLSDQKETGQGTNALKQDSDGDGVIDSKDKFPLDPKKSQASIIEAITLFIKNREFPFVQILAGLGLLAILALFIARKRK